MPSLTVIRFLSLAIMGLLIIGIPHEVRYFSVLISFSVAHYILSAIYSVRMMPANPRQPRFWLFVGLLLCAIIGFALPGDTVFRLILLFGVHHVLNEVYLDARQPSAPVLDTFGRVSAIAFHSFLYFALIVNDPVADFLDRRVIALGLVVTTPIYVYAGGFRLAKFEGLDIFKTFSFELACAALGAASLLGYIHLRFMDVVFYHFILWAFVPLLSPKRKNLAFTLRYGLETVALTGLGILVSPVGLHRYILGGSWFLQIFYLGSYIHILSSVALSKAQPDWVNRIFRPGEFSKVSSATKATARRPNDL